MDSPTGYLKIGATEIYFAKDMQRPLGSNAQTTANHTTIFSNERGS